MSKPALSVKVFGIYLIALGLVLLIAPNVILYLTAIPATREVWIRGMGVLVVNIGVQYVVAARSGARAMIAASVYTRLFVFAAFTAFVLLRFTTTGLILFGVADLVGAVWTRYELRREAVRR